MVSKIASPRRKCFEIKCPQVSCNLAIRATIFSGVLQSITCTQHRMKRMAGQCPAQQSVHWTLGSLPHLQVFFWLRVFSCSQTLSTPAPAPVTQTVRQRKAQPDLHNSVKAICNRITRSRNSVQLFLDEFFGRPNLIWKLPNIIPSALHRSR